MAAVVLEGETLGQRQRSYNKILNETTGFKGEDIAEINYEESDLENLLKIDLACKNRDLEFVLRVLQSEDIMYVSRALRRCAWLVTDERHKHVIHPEHLHRQLQPRMTVKAFNKLLLHIRLNLKDEDRAEEFFNYYKEKDFNTAIKWLPLCTIELAGSVLNKHADVIPEKILKKLCRKSATCLERYFSSRKSFYRYSALASTAFLIKNNMESYLNIVESDRSHNIPHLGAKKTRLIMEKCPERVMSNLDKYYKCIDRETFAKYIKTEVIKDFILTHIKNRDFSSWFSHNNIGPFIRRLPEESRFDVLKEIFIDKKHKEIEEGIILECSGCGYRSDQSTYQNIYCWYKYAPFDRAFVDLTKLIRSESKPTERTAMFEVLVTCAGRNIKNIHSLLKYYRERHINEPFKFKIQFVNVILTHTDTHKFDKETWGYLNDLFSSMEVYAESDNQVQFCVKAIVLYNVIHDESIPEIIQQKSHFHTFRSYQKKLNAEEKEKVFQYVFKSLTSKLDVLDMNKEKEFSETVDVLNKMIKLLKDWNKDLKEYPVVLNKIKEAILVKEEQNWVDDLTQFFDAKKSWRKLLFAQSILLKPNQETCINALKHGPELLEKYKNIVEEMCLNDKSRKIQFLKKLRIYWHESLANTYKDLFMSKLDQKTSHKSVITGLCTLLPRKELSDFVEKYAPVETKIDWSQQDEVELSIRKNIAMNLLLARPQPSPTLALLYAKGDYLQFILPSLKSILHNISSAKIREHLPRLLKAPVSLQKHGIRVAFAKLRHDEIKELFSDIWKSSKNSSIRADIFNQTQSFLCEETDEAVIREMWQLLSIFIDNLTADENKLVYSKLSKVEKVPMLVRPEYWIKSYKFLKSLPPQANCDVFVAHLMSNMFDVMHLLDNELMAEIFMESLDKFGSERYYHSNLLPVCLLSTKTEEMHKDRIDKVLIPFLDRTLKMLEIESNKKFVKFNLEEIFSNLDQQFERVVLNQKMFMPIPLYDKILKKLTAKLSVMEDYVMITTRKLTLECVKVFDNVIENDQTLKAERDSPEMGDCEHWGRMYDEAAPEFGKICVEILKNDIKNHFPSIYVLFAEAFDQIFTGYGFNSLNKMRALKKFIELENDSPFYMIVMSLLPLYGYDEREFQFKMALLDDISRHTSADVKFHYWQLKRKLNRANL